MPYGAKTRPKDGIHKVVAGDTISSIAAFYGITDWENKLWNAAENAQLKQERVNPNTLVPGDQVFIPELQKKQEARPSDAWHDFHVVRNKRFLRLKLQSEDSKPLANRKYELTPLETFRGVFVQQGQTTDADGKIEEDIPHTMLEADLSLPDDGLRVRLKIGYLLPLPMKAPVKSAGGLNVAGGLGGLAGKASGLLDAAKGALGGATGGLGGALGGSGGGSASGGLSLGAGGSGGGLSGGLGGGLGGAAGAAGGIAGQATGALGGAAKGLLSSASTMAGSIVKAVSGALGDGAFGNETDPNIPPAAQRLDSMGFDPGDTKSDRRSPQFSAALMSFQAWCKDQGSMPADAGGPLGGLTSPGGALGGGGGIGGALGSIAGAVAGPVLAAVGLTGQLDQPTIDALKKSHGC
jgi:hypothetical protein